MRVEPNQRLPIIQFVIRMWYKQQVQFAIWPRILKAIRVCYKGQYSLQFELLHESEQGTLTSAYPYTFKLPSSGHPTKSHPLTPTSKTPRTKIQNNRGSFQTSIFNVTYESHTQYFDDLCVFKMEYKMKKNARGKTYLLLHLLSHRKIIVENDSQLNKLQLKLVTQKLFTRKINLNFGCTRSMFQSTHKLPRNLHFLNTFVQVQLQDNDFFGYVLMFISAVPVGWRIRDNKMSLCSFLCEDPAKKKKIMEGQRKYMKTASQVGKSIKDLTKQCSETVYEFYEATIKSSIMVSLQLQKFWQQIRQSLFPSSNGELSETHLVSEEEKSYLYALRELQWVNDQNIWEYYECNDINSLYFEIHHIGQENMMICDNVKALWQKVLGFLKQTTVDQFESCCIKEINQLDREWKANCVLFIENRLDLISTSSNSLSVNYFHSKTTKHLPRMPTNLDYKVVKSPKEQQKNSQPSQEMMGIREVEVAKFKEWRKAYVDRELVYYDEQYFHPLLLIQNYQSSPKKEVKHGHIGLVVFVHGFKGSEYDLQRASQYLLKYNQNVEVLRIKTLENDVDYSIEEMAVVVASEIKRYIICSFLKIDSISIVGYSLGGIISRAALRHLQQFSEKMNIFITFSSPHLGTQATNNSLVKFGIWYMTKLNKCRVLEELHTSRDFTTSTKSYMKLLSEQDSISWFKKMVLVSCAEDQFVPHLSSRVDEDIQGKTSLNAGLVQKLSSPSRKMQMESINKLKSEMSEMSENIRKYAKRIQRVQVWFDNQNKKSTIDKLTGRQSHIQFLDNCCFLKWFFKIYGPQL